MKLPSSSVKPDPLWPPLSVPFFSPSAPVHSQGRGEAGHLPTPHVPRVSLGRGHLAPPLSSGLYDEAGENKASESTPLALR